MKKIILLTLCFISVDLFNSAFAQGFYAAVGGGYGFPAAEQEYLPSQTSSGFTSNSYSLGSGVNFEILGGYMWNKNMGAEIGISYLSGSSTTATDNEAGSPVITETETEKGNILRAYVSSVMRAKFTPTWSRE